MTGIDKAMTIILVSFVVLLFGFATVATVSEEQTKRECIRARGTMANGFCSFR